MSLQLILISGFLLPVQDAQQDNPPWARLKSPEGGARNVLRVTSVTDAGKPAHGELFVHPLSQGAISAVAALKEHMPPKPWADRSLEDLLEPVAQFERHVKGRLAEPLPYHLAFGFGTAEVDLPDEIPAALVRIQAIGRAPSTWIVRFGDGTAPVDLSATLDAAAEVVFRSKEGRVPEGCVAYVAAPLGDPAPAAAKERLIQDDLPGLEELTSALGAKTAGVIQLKHLYPTFSLDLALPRPVLREGEDRGRIQGLPASGRYSVVLQASEDRRAVFGVAAKPGIVDAGEVEIRKPKGYARLQLVSEEGPVKGATIILAYPGGAPTNEPFLWNHQLFALSDDAGRGRLPIYEIFDAPAMIAAWAGPLEGWKERLTPDALREHLAGDSPIEIRLKRTR